MMFYNFCGIFVFSLLLVQLFYTLIYGPFSAMFTLEHNIKMSTNAVNLNSGVAFNIEHYKCDSNEDGVERDNNYLPKDLPPTSEIGKPLIFNNLNQSNSRNNENTTLFDMSNSKQQRSGNLF
jgi:hypothetical protein